MTPETQSVCKHCQKEIKLIGKCWHLSFGDLEQCSGATLCLSKESLFSQHEPVAEPVSTGEQPPREPCEDCVWYACAGLPGGCGCKCHKQAARPSGPSAKACDWPFSGTGICGQSEACIQANRCLKNLPSAPQPSASPCKHCNGSRWKIIAGDGCAVQDRTIPCPHCSSQTSAEPQQYRVEFCRCDKPRKCEDDCDVCLECGKDIDDFTAAPQPVSRAAPLTHARSCPALTPMSDADCTCGLQWRIALQTEQTMHAAWRKRAEEAEAREIERAGEAPKVDIRQKCVNFLCLRPYPKVDELAEFIESLRPYFPPASLTLDSNFAHDLYVAFSPFLDITDEGDGFPDDHDVEFTVRWHRVKRAFDLWKQLPGSTRFATPASTARTDELVAAVKSMLEWMPKYSIGSSGYLRQERVKRALAAPGSVPQAPQDQLGVAIGPKPDHLPLECKSRHCSQHRDTWHHYESVIATGVSQAEPPGATTPDTCHTFDPIAEGSSYCKCGSMRSVHSQGEI